MMSGEFVHEYEDIRADLIPVVAPNNAPTVGHCLGVAGQKNGVALALDVAGDALAFVPGGGLALAGAQMGVAVASTVNSAVHQDVAGSMAGIAGFQVAPLAPAAEVAGVAWAKAIPFVGGVVSAYSTIHDGLNFWNDYQSCMAGH